MKILNTSNLSPFVIQLRNEILETNAFEFLKNGKAFKKVDSYPYEEGCYEEFFTVLKSKYRQSFPEFIITTMIDEFDHIAMNLNTDTEIDYEKIMCNEFEIGGYTLILGLSFDFSDLFIINIEGKWVVHLDKYEDECTLYESIF